MATWKMEKLCAIDWHFLSAVSSQFVFPKRNKTGSGNKNVAMDTSVSDSNWGVTLTQQEELWINSLHLKKLHSDVTPNEQASICDELGARMCWIQWITMFGFYSLFCKGSCRLQHLLPYSKENGFKVDVMLCCILYACWRCMHSLTVLKIKSGRLLQMPLPTFYNSLPNRLLSSFDSQSYCMI